MNLTFTQATEAECDVLGALAARTFTETFGPLYTPENLASHLALSCSPDYFRKVLATEPTFLMHRGTQPIGYGKIGWMRLPVDAPPPGSVELHRCYIDAPYQGQGFGRLLVAHLLAQPPMQEAPMIYLSVMAENLRAQGLYRQFGFVPVGEYQYRVGTQFDRELIMARTKTA